MQLGVGTARRGWVEPRHVLNTRPRGGASVHRRQTPPPKCYFLTVSLSMTWLTPSIERASATAF